MRPGDNATPLIRWFLCDQILDGRCLTHPRDLVITFSAIAGAKNCEDRLAVHDLEQKKGLPVCPAPMLEQLWGNRKNGGKHFVSERSFSGRT